MTPETVDMIIEMADAGYDLTDIATHVGASEKDVADVLEATEHVEMDEELPL